MTAKAIGLYAKRDNGWQDVLRAIFKANGFADEEWAIAAIELQVYEKIIQIPKDAPLKQPRLKFTGATEAYGSSKLSELVKEGDEVHVVWIGHSQYLTTKEDVFSMKFLPHCGLKDDDAPMSAKELAKAISAVCRKGGVPIYPNTLTINSCYSAKDRFMGDERFPYSKHSDPLGNVVALNLKGITGTKSTCKVFTLNRPMIGVRLREMKIPPSSGETRTDYDCFDY
jgi:hypothetical protein